MHPFLDGPRPLAFAHRGGAGDFPENTMPAFAHAAGLGYRYMETDVHATIDGVLVAFHDPDLQRTCDRPGRIDALPWREVAAARVRGLEPIPRFDELLDAFPDARFNIDCKADAGAGPLIELLRRRPELLDRVLVAGFSDARLRRIRNAVGARLATSFGPGQIAALLAAGRVPQRPFGGGQAAQVPVRLASRRLVRLAHARGLHVHVWTVDEPAEMHRLLDLGVDGLMTDHPAVLRDVLTSRAAWAG